MVMMTSVRKISHSVVSKNLFYFYFYLNLLSYACKSNKICAFNVFALKYCAVTEGYEIITSCNKEGIKLYHTIPTNPFYILGLKYVYAMWS